MSINATLLGTIVLVLVPVFALVSYFLGLVPVLGLIFIAVLALKSDLPKEAV